MPNTEPRFCPICDAMRDTPSPVLAGMAEAPALIADALARRGDNGGDGWSPREVIAHLADSEIGFGSRIRLILTEDDPHIASYDEQAWSRTFFYDQRDAAIARDAFGAVRAANVELLERLGEGAWTRPYRQGDARRTLGDLVHHRADHDLQHLRQIAGG